LLGGGGKIRRCDKCGKEKEVSGGKTCENGHFICREDVWAGTFSGLLGDSRKACPLCGKTLR